MGKKGREDCNKQRNGHLNNKLKTNNYNCAKKLKTIGNEPNAIV
jgi:hypothetical protein